MSTIVLARKYRPRNFESLVGQPHVVQALANALTQQRLHHAYLFTGTRGVGKTTISRILAKSLNCTGADGQGGITAHPCGVCDACRDIDAGRFIDYIELDAASNRGVDEITRLLDQSVYKPVVGRYKVYLIDEVHMLSMTAFNAMLKTLEEPPDYLKFILATTDPQKVPATVLSRCLQFNLRPMAPQTIVEHLRSVLADESIEAPPSALRLIARAARGSMRDALSLTDQAIAYGSGRIEEGAVQAMLGSVDRDHAVRLTEALASRDGAALVAAVDALRELGLSATGALEEMAALLQQMAVLQAVPEAADGDDPETPALLALAGRLPADETQLLYSIVVNGRAELALAPDEYSGLVMVLLRMMAFAPLDDRSTRAPGTPPPVAAVRPASAGGNVRAAAPSTVATRGTASTPATAATAATAATVLSAAGTAAASVTTVPATTVPATTIPRVAALDDTDVRSPADRWDDAVRGLIAAGSIVALARELAVQAECVAVVDGDDEVWRLRVERETLRSPLQRDRLQAALAAARGRPVRIELEAGVADDSPARRDAAERSRRQAEAERIIHDDPLVKALMAQYKTARIVPGSVKPL